MTSAYYNEHDPYAAQWLRNLITAGHIAPGDVDERSILDVSPDDLAGYTQCHFFAGIGVWSHALRMTQWPDSRPVWTGSCPCQPFSVAGRGAGHSDERHLWPYWHALIEQRRPPVVFGEQVEAAIRHGWLDLVQADMEGIGYAFAASGIPAAGVGAPHIRQRLFFMAYDDQNGRGALPFTKFHNTEHNAESCRYVSRMDDDDDARLEGLGRGHQAASGWDGTLRPATEAGESLRVEYAESHGRNQRRPESRGRSIAAGCTLSGMELALHVGRERGQEAAPGHDDDRAAPEWAQSEHGLGITSAHRLSQHGAGPTNGHWRSADWLACRDGKWRPVEPGTFPLAHGAAARVGRLRAYGNAIVPQVAAEMIAAYMECRP